MGFLTEASEILEKISVTGPDNRLTHIHTTACSSKVSVVALALLLLQYQFRNYTQPYLAFFVQATESH
jgi:hypothetical protein